VTTDLVRSVAKEWGLPKKVWPGSVVHLQCADAEEAREWTRAYEEWQRRLRKGKA
jgi:hypothetical protein